MRKSIGLVLPSIPKAFKDLFSQFRSRKRYAPVTWIVDIPNANQGNLSTVKTYGAMQHFVLYFQGTYQDREFGHLTIEGYQQSEHRGRAWRTKDPYLLQVGYERFILMNPPDLKVRPFPGEDFRLMIGCPERHTVSINYFPLKFRGI